MEDDRPDENEIVLWHLNNCHNTIAELYHGHLEVCPHFQHYTITISHLDVVILRFSKNLLRSLNTMGLPAWTTKEQKAWLIEFIKDNYDPEKGLKELKDAALEEFQ